VYFIVFIDVLIHGYIGNVCMGYMSRSGGTSVAPPSSQSHRVHLPFNAAPEVLLQNVDSRRSVEVMLWHPGSPNPTNVQELCT